MKTLYVSQQGRYLALKGESLVIQYQQNTEGTIQLPLLEQVLIFGKSQLTTQAIRSCLWRKIPIAYLSRSGGCYGRVLSIDESYRHGARYQQQLSDLERLEVARQIVQAKLQNSRTLLLRRHRTNASSTLAEGIERLSQLILQGAEAENSEQLMGYEGAGAAQYFRGFAECITNPGFSFPERSRRPPKDPVNALLSFGYQVLWNHLLSLIELQGLDPYSACLHQGTERHAALASDLIEEFRGPIVDGLVLWLINCRVMDAEADFEPRRGGCYLNGSGRRKYLSAFVKRMEQDVMSEPGETQPRWDLLNRQVKGFKRFVYDSTQGYQPYRIR
ncbi:MAG: CRISPR-associated endonuclease Cas1 [Oscillatoriales cyanobacterium RM2_1_1]|nr:CRISPR-associated endonuclease Cas1 [Oscillatoriales cyanobacterium SM2_3_0]NJO47158.1 CRISPR-associated endonuclease Cas1 [Oscillatoriales cyanobacterium RM2_1_1]